MVREFEPAIFHCTDERFCGGATPNTKRLVAEISENYMEGLEAQQDKYRESIKKGDIIIGSDGHATLTEVGNRRLDIIWMM